MYIRWFADLNRDDIPTAGGKGANLGELCRGRFPVPPGFVITTNAYRSYVAHNRLQDQILAPVSRASADEPAALEAAAVEINELFTHGEAPAALTQEVEAAYAKLVEMGAAAVAVRSSATAEDLPQASFAGQQDTYLNVRGAAELLEAMKKCWASLWTARAMGYRAKQGIPSESVAIAVVVQQMIPAEAAGVLFTVNPVSGARDEVVINAAWGLGEAIVSGQVTPDTIVADKATGRTKQSTIAEKTVMAVAVEAGTAERAVSDRRRTARVLDASQVAELTRLGRSIEHHYGAPQDVEWCWADRAFFVVQTRPITALPEAPVRWEPPREGLWVHGAGAIEMFSEPVSPVFETLVLPIFNQGMVDWLASYKVFDLYDGPVSTIVNGYIYGSVNMRIRPRHVLPWIRLYRAHATSMAGWPDALQVYRETVAKLQPADPAALPAGELCRLAEALVLAGVRYWLYVTMIVRPIIDRESAFRKFYNHSARRRGGPEPQVFLRGQETRALGADRTIYRLAEMVRELPGLDAALEAVDGNLDALPDTPATRELRQRFERYLAEYGHQIYSFDPLLATLADDLRPVLLAVQSYLRGQESPDERQSRLVAEREAELKQLESRLSAKRFQKLCELMGRAQEGQRMREDAMFELGLAWRPLRRILLALGNRMATAAVVEEDEQIFWLRWEEIKKVALQLDAGAAPSSLLASARERHLQWQAQQHLRPPAVLPEGRKHPFWLKWVTPVPESAKHGADALSGFAASPGTVTAVARVIASPHEMERLKQGEILVARATTPAWTPLFARAAGLVTDLGGALSHGSLVAREYGIPAVMGTAVATQRITDGQTLTIDGAAGKVYLHGRPLEGARAGDESQSRREPRGQDDER